MCSLMWIVGVNPDNPSGSFIKHEDMKEIKHAKKLING